MIVNDRRVAKSALLHDACRCQGRGICLCCRRWDRHDREVTERRAQWAAYEGRDR